MTSLVYSHKNNGKRCEVSGVNFFSQTLNHLIRNHFSKSFHDKITMEDTLENQKRCDFLLSLKDGVSLISGEFKIPHTNISRFDIKKDAFSKAKDKGTKYYLVSDFVDTEIYRVSDGLNAKPFYPSIHISNLHDVDDLKKKHIENKILREWKKLLREIERDMVKMGYTKKVKPKKKLDELFKKELYDYVQSIGSFYTDIIEEKYYNDTEFQEYMNEWFNGQNWNFVQADEERVHKFMSIAGRHVSYWIVVRLLFYNILRDLSEIELPKLELQKGITSGKFMHTMLNAHFQEVSRFELVKDINDIIEPFDIHSHLSYQNNQDLIDEIITLTHTLSEYDYSTMEEEFLGKIFERIIPADERHDQGQFYTNTDLIDLINAFVIRSVDDKVVDFSCGTSPFLVRSAKYKQWNDPRASMDEIRSTLVGVDIDYLSVALSLINMVLLEVVENDHTPKIVKSDFSKLTPSDEFLYRKKTLHKRDIDYNETITINGVEIPLFYDGINGNPPYTSSKHMNRIVGLDKEQFIEKCTDGIDQKISKRSSMYAYWFYHGWKFLKPQGRIGIIVENTWLNRDYGYDLQKFFLKNFKIIAIIGTNAEKWFKHTDVETCIVILERCDDVNERMKNNVIFVRFNTEIEPLFPKDDTRFKIIHQYKNLICNATSMHSDDEITVVPMLQKELWDEGYDAQERDYMGSNWMKHMFMPEIYETLQPYFDHSVELEKIGDLKRGVDTGASKFFVLDEKTIHEYGIEDEYLVPCLLTSDKNHAMSVNVRDVKKKMLVVTKSKKQLQGTNVLKYIEYGENIGIHKASDCSKRQKWYNVIESRVSNRSHYQSHIHIPIVLQKEPHIPFSKKHIISKNYGLFNLNKKSDTELCGALLNTSISLLMWAMSGVVKNGNYKVEMYKQEKLKILDPRKIPKDVAKEIIVAYRKMRKRKMNDVFTEFGSEDEKKITLDTVQQDRRELDRIVMNHVNMDENDQVAIYKSIVKNFADVKNRQESNDSTIIDGLDVTKVAESFIEKNKEHFEKFSRIYRAQKNHMYDLNGRVRAINGLHGLKINVGTKEISCESKKQQKYYYMYLQRMKNMGLTKIHFTPHSKKTHYLIKLYNVIHANIHTYIQNIVSINLKEEIKNEIYKHITSQL